MARYRQTGEVTCSKPFARPAARSRCAHDHQHRLWVLAFGKIAPFFCSGWFAVLGELCCLVTAVVVLPAVLAPGRGRAQRVNRASAAGEALRFATLA